MEIAGEREIPDVIVQISINRLWILAPFYAQPFATFVGGTFSILKTKFENIISDDGHRMMTDRNIY